MKYHEIVNEIEKYLAEKKGEQVTIKDLASVIKIKKHQFKLLIRAFGEVTRHSAEISEKTSRKVSSFIEGIFDATSLTKGYSYAFVIAEEDIFIFAEDTLNAFHGDKVAVEIKYRRRGKKYGVIKKVIQRKNEYVVGNLVSIDRRYILTDISTKFHSDIIIYKPGEAKDGQKVVVKITDWGDRNLNRLPSGEITEILGNAGDPEIEVLSVIKQFGLPLTFPDSVLAETDEISEIIPQDEIAIRKDYRSLLTFTIDPISAKDYDDAISLEVKDSILKIYVHIADVSHYVRKGCAIYKEAFNRGNSYYFPRRVIPMLPEKLSNKVCSLRPYEDKLTLTVVTTLDKNMIFVSQEMYQSVINSDARLTYEEVDELFAGREHNIPEDVAAALLRMRELSAYFTTRKIIKGYIFFDLPEVDYEFNDDGKVINLKRSSETESHTMIENFMVLANECVCRKLSETTKSTLYRVHETPDPEKIEEIRQLLKNYGIKMAYNDNYNFIIQDVLKSMPTHEHHMVFDRLLLRKMKKARYDVINYGHFGLALQFYTHFTSPIRRLCDLIVHTQMKKSIFGRNYSEYSKQEMKESADQASEKELIADESERNVDELNKRLFMKDKLGEIFSGVIVSMNKTSVFIELEKYPVITNAKISEMSFDSFVYFEDKMMLNGSKTGVKFKLTDKVNVKIIKVTDDIYTKIII